MFAETSSEIQVGASFEPSCTIEMPSVVSVTKYKPIYVSSRTLTAHMGDSFSLEALGVNAQITCASGLEVVIVGTLDQSNGVGTKNVGHIASSGIFPITNTPDPNDDGVYSVGVYVQNILVDFIDIAGYKNNTGTFLGKGENVWLNINIAWESENCPVLSIDNSREICPAGDIAGSMTVSLSW